VFPRLSVAENLELGAYIRNDKQGILDDYAKIYALFPVLRERMTQLAGTLSGGEQQMLAVGRAMMARPRLLLLDEPSLGLAPLIVQRIFEVILELNRQGTTILLVEQNARMALKIAHRGYVLETGQVIAQGTGAELLADPKVQAAYLGE
jgi:branched-chain amino acid transport system ATP-binding protein